MTTWRKRPVTVEAIRLRQGNDEGLLEFVRMHAFQFRIDEDGWTVWTVDGNEVLVPWGAYIVMDRKGYPYPCDAEIFEATHDRVAGSEAPAGVRVT